MIYFSHGIRALRPHIHSELGQKKFGIFNMVGNAGKIWQQPPPFNGQNYDTWPKKMKTIMVANDL